ALAVREADLLLDLALERRALEAVLDRLVEGGVEVGPGRAARPGVRELVARAALGDELLLAGDEILVAALDVASRERRHGEGAEQQSRRRAAPSAGRPDGDLGAQHGGNSIRCPSARARLRHGVG